MFIKYMSSENNDVVENSNPVNDNVAENNNEKVKKINLLEFAIDDDSKALSCLIGFINIAQKRGAFAINESAKIHECIQMFIKK